MYIVSVDSGKLMYAGPVDTAQVPPLHEMPAAHARAHVPQLFASVSRLSSQPFEAMASQLPQPDAHADTAQAPAEQAAVAWASEHTVPHVPQLLTSVGTPSSQPLQALPSPFPQP